MRDTVVLNVYTRILRFLGEFFEKCGSIWIFSFQNNLGEQLSLESFHVSRRNVFTPLHCSSTIPVDRCPGIRYFAPRLNFYLLDCTRTCLFPHNNHVRSIQRIKRGEGEGAREGSKIIFEMDGISALARPWSPPPTPSLSRPQSMEVQMGGNDVALFTFFHTRATTRRESGLWPALNRRRGDGRPLFFPPVLIYPVRPAFRHGSKEIFGSLFPKVLLFLKVYLYSTGTREGKEGGNWGARIPRNVSSKRGALKSFVARLIKGFVVRPIVNQFKSEEQEIAPSKKREKRRDDP